MVLVTETLKKKIHLFTLPVKMIGNESHVRKI